MPTIEEVYAGRSSSRTRYWWRRVEVADRGFDSPCWIARKGVKSHSDIRARLNELVGECGDNEVHMHTCERWGEKNRCINPEHIRVGTRSENQQHWHDLRAAAGVPFNPERPWQRGVPLSEETRCKIRASKTGQTHTDETKRKMQRHVQCDCCEYSSTQAHVSLHRRLHHVDST